MQKDFFLWPTTWTVNKGGNEMHGLLHEKTGESVNLEFIILKTLMQLPSWLFSCLSSNFQKNTGTLCYHIFLLNYWQFSKKPFLGALPYFELQKREVVPIYLVWQNHSRIFILQIQLGKFQITGGITNFWSLIKSLAREDLIFFALSRMINIFTKTRI